jgi:hypothetical protein
VIVIVDAQNDFHARVVAHLLGRRGVPTFIADPTEIGNGAELSFWPADPAKTEWRRSDGASVRFADVRALWLRRLYPPNITADVSDVMERSFMTREWWELLHGMIESLDAPVINPRTMALVATKPRQLAVARRCGLSVPDTLITSSARRAAEFVRGEGVTVHKTLTPIPDRFLATKPWEASDEDALGELELAPTIFQRLVDGSRELRITAVGDQLFAAEFTPAFLDGRLDLASPYTPHELPTSVSRGLRRLLDELGLAIGAIDMRIDARGEYQFLEVNTQGQFLWIEIHTGQPISAAVADLLCMAAERR